MNNKALKIKLAAIARDEAAYLPEWIFHHLAFGFDEIEIYINNTSDNSLAILANITKHYPVVVTNADQLFQRSNNDFQLLAYQALTDQAISDGFTHIMFLDIDEFWTPADFKTDVKQALVKFNYPQALSLNWFIHCDEGKFASCYREQLIIRPDTHVKTLFQLDTPWDKVEIHNIVGKEVHYTRGNGKPYDFGDSPHCGLTDHQCLDHDFFVIHRMFRSQMEYVSLLGRGRANKLKLKDNRNGYYNKDNLAMIHFEAKLLDSYNLRFEKFVKQCQLNELIDGGRAFVNKRFDKVQSWIKKATPKEAVVFNKLLLRVELPEIKLLKKKLLAKIELAELDIDNVETLSYRHLFSQLLFKLLRKFKLNRLAGRLYLKGGYNQQKDGGTIIAGVERALLNIKYPANKHADVYREMAVYFYQNQQLTLAYALISKARQKRPNGPTIVKLHEQFQKEL
jgi:hypothetical protein